MQEYLFVEADERAAQRLRRKALDTADALMTTLDDIAQRDASAIHDARRRLKELRALTQLLGVKKDERRFFRDAGRLLSAARDAKAAVEGFDRLRERFAAEWTPRQYQKIRRGLKSRVDAAIDPAALDHLRGALAIERGHIAAWPVDDMHREDLLDALRRGYRRARRGFRRASSEHSIDATHEFRKRVKTHWYGMQFLTEVGVTPADARAASLRSLSRALGQHHDLVLIDNVCATSPQLLGSSRYIARFRAFIARALAGQLDEAERAGALLFRERPRDWIATAARLRIGPKQSPRRLTRVGATRANAG